MLELAMFGNEFDKDGLSSEQQGTIELTKLKTLLDHHNKPLIYMLEQRDLIDIRLLLEEPEVLLVKELLEKEERLVQEIFQMKLKTFSVSA